MGHVACRYPIPPSFFLPEKDWCYDWTFVILGSHHQSQSCQSQMVHDLFVKYLSVSFGSFILCKIQEQLSLVVIGQWIVLNLRVKKVLQISLLCWWYSFLLLLLFTFYGIKPLPLIVLVSKVVKKTKAWNIQLNILCLIHFIFQDDWVLLRWINATL